MADAFPETQSNCSAQTKRIGLCPNPAQPAIPTENHHPSSRARAGGRRPLERNAAYISVQPPHSRLHDNLVCEREKLVGTADSHIQVGEAVVVAVVE